ncbi:hypothetical protein ACOME3_008932 [Neoechinorhynchus agilis]
MVLHTHIKSVYSSAAIRDVLKVDENEEMVLSRCNMANLHTESIIESYKSKKQLRGILEDFAKLTGSCVAQALLDDFDNSCKKFVKILSHDSERHKAALMNSTPAGISAQMSNTIEEFSEKSAKGDEYELCPDLEDTGSTLKHRGFMIYERQAVVCRNVKERMNDLEEVLDMKSLETLVKCQASRCINCGVPFCQSSESGCPLGVVIPDFTKLVTDNDYRSALHRILQSNNFPEFTGRVCPATCETACVFQPDPVTIRNIELMIAEYGFEKGYIVPEVPPHRTGHRVTIIGSGPAGLAAAAQLNKAGHSVYVYDKNENVGGLLRFGILPTRLSPKVIERRVDILRKEGITFLVNYEVTLNHFNNLLTSSSAVILALGSDDPEELVIKGRYLDNVFTAPGFLANHLRVSTSGCNSKYEDRPKVMGKRVVVISEAKYASSLADCIMVLVREKISWIKCVIVQSGTVDAPSVSWAQKAELATACEEAAILSEKDVLLNVSEVREIIGDNTGRVLGVIAVDSKNGGVDIELPCDMVFICTQSHQNGEDSNPLRGVLRDVVNPKQNGIKIRNLFACGDCRHGASAIVHAIADGRRVAREVDLYLMKDSHLAAAGGIVKDANW